MNERSDLNPKLFWLGVVSLCLVKFWWDAKRYVIQDAIITSASGVLGTLLFGYFMWWLINRFSRRGQSMPKLKIILFLGAAGTITGIVQDVAG